METSVRNTFIQENMGLVHMVLKKHAHRIVGHSFIDREDLENIGAIGLIKAYDRFDPSYGVKFSTYAVPTIMGELQRYLRDSLDIIRFTRQSKTDYYQIVKANLINEKPSIIASLLEISIDNVENALAYYRYKYAKSLDKTINNDEGTTVTLGDAIGTEIDLDSDVEIELFLKRFDKRTRKVLELRLQDFGQVEIGKIIGISQVQVSRILAKLKNQIKGEMELNEKKNVDYNLAKKLAKETELNGYEISHKSGVSAVTAYSYIKQYRATKEEIEEVKKKMEERKSPVKTYKLSPEELEKYKAGGPVETSINHKSVAEIEEPINEEPIPVTLVTPVKAKAELEDSYGHMAMTFKVTSESATSQLEEIIRAMNVLGFENLEITIQSKKVA